MPRKRKPDELVAKRQTGLSRDETLWFQDCLDRKERWGVISHGDGSDFIVIELADDEPKEYGRPSTRVRVFLRRPLVKKLLPFLTAFAEGGDFGVKGEKRL